MTTEHDGRDGHEDARERPTAGDAGDATGASDLTGLPDADATADADDDEDAGAGLDADGPAVGDPEVDESDSGSADVATEDDDSAGDGADDDDAGDGADDDDAGDGADDDDDADDDDADDLGLEPPREDDTLGTDHGERYGAIRHGDVRRRSVLARVLSAVGIGTAVALVSATSVAAIAAGTLSSAVETVHIGPTGKPAVTGAEALQGAVDFVVVGSDTRQDQAEAIEGDPGTLNNDVTMLVHISADHQQMTAISIPRDTVVPLPACTNSDTGERLPPTRGMFNTALQRGGTEGGLNCVVAAVANLTGVEARFAGIFKFDGVAAMSTAVGGVEVCVAEPIRDRYVGLHLEPGMRTLEGRTASAFLRSRHGVADGSDLGRISNQQVFLSALARKVLAPGGTLSHPVQLYQLAHAALSNMIVSENLKSADTMVSLALTMRDMDLSNILFVQYPTVEDPEDVNRLVPDEAAAHALNVAVQTDAKTNLSASALGRGALVDESAPSSSPSATGSGTAGTGTGAPSTPSGTADGAGTNAGAGGADAGADEGGADTGSQAGGPASAPAATGGPTAESTALPSSITGQTASEQTCSKGSG